MMTTNERRDTYRCMTTETTLVAFARCREEALRFMRESDGWTKSDLCAWLNACYLPLTASGDASLTAEILKHFPADQIELALAAVRGRVIRMLHHLTRDRVIGVFEWEELATELTVPCRDAKGDCQYLPNADTADLADHVVALFSADYLMRRDDYVGLSVCSVCFSVEIDSAARRRGTCAAHSHVHPMPRLAARHGQRRAA